MNQAVNYHAQFPQNSDIIYLNHAAVGPWPLCTEAAVSAFAKENVVQGASNYPAWQQTEDDLKQLLKQLVNAQSVDEIALAKSTSEALSVIAHGITWHKGDNVVLSAWEFPSNRIVWESLSSYGVEVRIVETTRDNPEEQLINACDKRTRLLSSSSVHYADGFKVNLAALGAHCNKHSILFCIDAIQSLGALMFDAQAYQADFVVADGHKWMLSPEGLALFYCRASAMEQLSLKQFGWHMVEHIGDYDRTSWQVATSARRFECGSPNMLGTHAMHASLDYLIRQIGIETIHDKVSRNTFYLIDLIKKNKKFKLQTDKNTERLSGIVNFSVNESCNRALHKTLMQNKVVCAYRKGGIRLAPHFYQTETVIEKAINKILTLL